METDLPAEHVPCELDDSALQAQAEPKKRHATSATELNHSDLPVQPTWPEAPGHHNRATVANGQPRLVEPIRVGSIGGLLQQFGIDKVNIQLTVHIQRCMPQSLGERGGIVNARAGNMLNEKNALTMVQITEADILVCKTINGGQGGVYPLTAPKRRRLN